MKFGALTDRQAATLVQAMSAVVSAGGTVIPLPIEVDALAAAQRHLFHRDPPLPLDAGKLPPDLTEVLAEPALRRSTVRLLAALAVIDPAISTVKVAVVEEAARRLGVAEFGLTLLHRIARGQYRRNGFALMKRFVNHYWSYTGKAGLRDWAAMLWPMMPWFPGLRRYLGQDALLARYRALEGLPPDTLGFAVHRYYAVNGFPVPGEPKSIPEGWARHEVYHVLANYNTNLQGELLLAGFIGGNTDEMCLDIVLPALVQLHAGKRFVPGPVAEGILQPDDFFRAVARGAAMNVDLLAGWRLWEAADQRLSDLRTRYGIPALTPEEHARLAAEEALLVPA